MSAPCPPHCSPGSMKTLGDGEGTGGPLLPASDFDLLTHHSLLQRFSKQGSWSSISAPGILLEMKLLRPHPRPTESETPAGRHPVVCSDASSRGYGAPSSVRTTDLGIYSSVPEDCSHPGHCLLSSELREVPQGTGPLLT